MADPILIRRLAARLAEAGEATPKDAAYWATLASMAVEEMTKVITVTTQPLPAERFLALAPLREGFRLVAKTPTLADLTPPVTEYFNAGGPGEVWLLEIKRVYAGT